VSQPRDANPFTETQDKKPRPLGRAPVSIVSVIEKLAFSVETGTARTQIILSGIYICVCHLIVIDGTMLID